MSRNIKGTTRDDEAHGLCDDDCRSFLESVDTPVSPPGGPDSTSNEEEENSESPVSDGNLYENAAASVVPNEVVFQRTNRPRQGEGNDPTTDEQDARRKIDRNGQVEQNISTPSEFQIGTEKRSARPPVRFAEEHLASLSGEQELEEDNDSDNNVLVKTGDKVAKVEDQLAEFLMTSVMKLTDEDRNVDLVATFASYSQKFNDEGFNTPTILESLKGEGRLDEYLVNTISMKKGHLMMFKEWLKET